ncbi:MAG TPA: hypothetical protein VMV72_13420 [Verrucomicrobiae bacterium]|nr:hypothetical protein [Verrucomicrobiae bacterium]
MASATTRIWATGAIAAFLFCLAVLFWFVAFGPPFPFWRATFVADRIEVERPEVKAYMVEGEGTNTVQHGPTIFEPSKKIVLMGEEARRAARLLRSERCVGHPMCLSEAQIRFYEGTNLLTEVGMCVQVLFIDGKWYAPSAGGESLVRSWSDRLRQPDRVESSP